MAAARIAALGTGGAAAIHLAVAGEHFAQWWAFGAFFLALTVVQGLLAWRLWSAATVRVAVACAAVNLATVALWVLTRTTGLPFGPEPGRPEAWGVTDGVCAALELLAAAASVLLLAQVRRTGTVGERSPSRAVAVVVGSTAALVVLASGMAVAAPAEHAGHSGHGDEAAAGAGDGAHSAHGGSAEGGTAQGNGERHAMADLPDVSRASGAQTSAARGLVTSLVADTTRYRDPAAATAAGYDVQAALARWSTRHGGKQPGQIAALHVPQRQARTDDRLVDPSAPETLIYHRAQDGTLTLIGVMFTAQGQQPPARYQPFLRWHYHHVCVAPDGTVSQPSGDDENAPCAAGTTSRTGGYMSHVWFVDPGSSSDQLRYAFALAPPRKQLQQAFSGAA